LQYIPLLLAALLATGQATAHHSFAATYDLTKPVRITGTLVAARWINPHAIFTVESRGSDGRVTRWTCEGAGVATLIRRGIGPTQLHVGETITVEGYRARGGASLMDLQRVQLADGRELASGTPGHGRPE
jgi:hypothetical protein